MQNEQNDAAYAPYHSSGFVSCALWLVICLLHDQGLLCLAFGARL